MLPRGPAPRRRAFAGPWNRLEPPSSIARAWSSCCCARASSSTAEAWSAIACSCSCSCSASDGSCPPLSSRCPAGSRCFPLPFGGEECSCEAGAWLSDAVAVWPCVSSLVEDTSRVFVSPWLPKPSECETSGGEVSSRGGTGSGSRGASCGSPMESECRGAEDTRLGWSTGPVAGLVGSLSEEAWSLSTSFEMVSPRLPGSLDSSEMLDGGAAVDVRSSSLESLPVCGVDTSSGCCSPGWRPPICCPSVLSGCLAGVSVLVFVPSCTGGVLDTEPSDTASLAWVWEVVGCCSTTPVSSAVCVEVSGESVRTTSGPGLGAHVRRRCLRCRPARGVVWRGVCSGRVDRRGRRLGARPDVVRRARGVARGGGGWSVALGRSRPGFGAYVRRRCFRCSHGRRVVWWRVCGGRVDRRGRWLGARADVRRRCRARPRWWFACHPGVRWSPGRGHCRPVCGRRRGCRIITCGLGGLAVRRRTGVAI